MKNSRGFTIFEVLIVLALFTILLGLGYFLSIDFYRSYLFHTEENILISVLERARSDAQNNIFETAHGVHLSAENYTVFRGQTYDPNNVTNEVTPRNPSIQISGITDVVFEQLSGDPIPAFPPSFSEGRGQIILSEENRSAVISINNEGRIDW